MTEELIFLRAVEIAEHDRRRDYIDKACNNNSELRAGVEALIEAHEAEDELLDLPANLPDTQLLDGSGELINVDQQIDGFKLLQVIGEGGFGVVYMAEQHDPLRRVALKVIKPGMDSKEVIARFESERQALALMNHHNIARIFGGGTTESSRPYFVMELVKGRTITEYCDEHQLTLRERLMLFIPVCQAVQHAHQKGIIHRDLKPSNVLVAEYDGVPVPKIIDFGVAKALNQRLTNRTMFTQYGQVLGTLRYMSPEQSRFNQLDIDTRSDIYSLGVILYELLTGTTPIDQERMQSAAFEELIRLIREEEAPKPSTKISTSKHLPAVARHRNVEPGRLSSFVRGDLDWIVMKSLEKDRGRRYSSAVEFGNDVQRFLDQEPVSASPPSFLYRVRKFSSRHRAAVVSGSLIVVLLCASLVMAWRLTTTYWKGLALATKSQLADLEREEEKSKREEAEAKARQERQRFEAEQRLRRETIPEIEKLIAEKDFHRAFEIVDEALRSFPGDTKLKAYWQQVAVPCNIQSEPSGAAVFLRPYGDLSSQWTRIDGATPCTATVGRGFYHFRIELDGYETVEGCAGPEAIEIERSLDRSGSIPDGMVRVIASSSGRVTDDFFIDRTEVTNEQFQRFVDRGGYANQTWWKVPVFADGKEVPWDQAMNRFVDKTGKSGPATWSDGHFPDGKADHPVNGISWYEAAAYAVFADKQLPTIHHWRAANGTGLNGRLVPFSNFGGEGTAKVATFAGVGPFGTYDTAGNVSEWCSTGSGYQNFFYSAGSAFNKPDYMFYGGKSDAISRDESHGLRCAKYIKWPSADLLAHEIAAEPIHLTSDAVSDEKFRLIRAMYAYRKRSLNAEVQAGRSSDRWTEKIITVDSAYGGRLSMHLFEPKSDVSSDQVLIACPGAGVRHLTEFQDEPYSFLPVERLIESGRAVVCPVYAGMYGRPEEFKEPATLIRQSRDLCRCVDYLRESEVYETSRIGFIGFSYGAEFGPIFLAMENRIELGILVNGGLPQNVLPTEMSPYNFVPRVNVPILMINGSEDALFPLETSQKPLFSAFGTPAKEKRHVVISGGHGVDPAVVESEAGDWLDEHFGPIHTTGADNNARRIASLWRNARFYLDAKKGELAEQRLRELIELLRQTFGEQNPELWKAHYELGRALDLQNDRLDERISVLELAFENQQRFLGPDHRDTLTTKNELAGATAWKGFRVVSRQATKQQYEAAYVSLTRATELSPDVAWTHTGLAWADYRLEEVDQAWQRLDTAMTLPDAWWASWYLRAAICWQRDQRLEALHWLRVAEHWHGQGWLPTMPDGIQQYASAQKTAGKTETMQQTITKLIERYPDEYSLLVQRAILHLKEENLTAAHTDLKRAFQLSNTLDNADLYALTSQLTKDISGMREANARLLAMANEAYSWNRGLRQNLIVRYARSPSNGEYGPILTQADDLLKQWPHDSVRLAKSIAEFRSGKDTEIERYTWNGNPEAVLTSLVFRCLKANRDGDRVEAIKLYDEAKSYASQWLPTPDGPDYKYTRREHGWAVAKVLLAEAEAVLELGDQAFDREVVEVVSKVRRELEIHLGKQSADRALFEVGQALTKLYAKQAD